MGKLFGLIHLVLAIFAIGDIMTRLNGKVPRVLWVICVVAVPIAGSCFWYYVQYMAPRHRALLREKRRSRLRSRNRHE